MTEKGRGIVSAVKLRCRALQSQPNNDLTIREYFASETTSQNRFQQALRTLCRGHFELERETYLFLRLRMYAARSAASDWLRTRCIICACGLSMMPSSHAAVVVCLSAIEANAGASVQPAPWLRAIAWHWAHCSAAIRCPATTLSGASAPAGLAKALVTVRSIAKRTTRSASSRCLDLVAI